jgi:alpha-tubulin suppressor-like RCC1 family protein
VRTLRTAAVVLAAAALLLVPPAPAVRAVPPAPMFVAIAAGGYHTCALTGGGAVECWGYNNAGQLGDGTRTDRTTPVDVIGLASGVTAISAGYYHTCALMRLGGVTCWGANDFGQLGDGTHTSSATPVDVVGLATGVIAISAGGVSTCALTNADAVWCWGNNTSGQLGDGTMTNSATPVAVSGLASGVETIVAGPDHACAVVGGGTVRCWGNNGGGQLGDGTYVTSTTPVAVSGLASGIEAIATGYSHTCALTAAGGVKCWGYNGDGRLGDGTMTITTTPVDVSGLASGVEAISVGYYHTCALVAAGGVKCWGNNYAGALGNGMTIDSNVPVNVVIHQTIALRASKPAGTLALGTPVTFTATVRPLPPAGTPAVARFVVYRRVDGVWRLSAELSVTADAKGVARLRWTFATAGSWYVRASARANASYTVSLWSPLIRYKVR